MADKIKKVRILRWDDDYLKKVFDNVAEENEADIFLNKKFVSRVVCSPFDCDSLIFGFLFVRNMISCASDVKSISSDVRNGNQSFYVVVEKSPTGNLLSSVSEDNKEFAISHKKILSLMNGLSEVSEVFQKTGGTHIAALSNGDVVYAAFEDVSRRSAVQKSIGYALKNNCLQNYWLLLTSARINGDIVKQAERANIKVIVSFSAATSYAIEIAEKSCITLVGFARRNRMNIYTVPERIVE
jgi:FdhD protein